MNTAKPETPRRGRGPLSRGLSAAIGGIKVAIGCGSLGRSYIRFAALILLGAALLSASMTWGLWIATESAADPGIFTRILTTVVRIIGTCAAVAFGPILSMNIVNILAPMPRRELLLSALHTIDSGRAAPLSSAKGIPLWPSIKMSCQRMFLFLSVSCLLVPLGTIPVVGPIGVLVAELAWASMTMSWELLTPYFDALEVRYHEQRTFVFRRWLVLFGFGLPFVAMSVIPVLGPLLMGLAQAAAAVLVVQEFSIAADLD